MRRFPCPEFLELVLLFLHIHFFLKRKVSSGDDFTNSCFSNWFDSKLFRIGSNKWCEHTFAYVAMLNSHLFDEFNKSWVCLHLTHLFRSCFLRNKSNDTSSVLLISINSVI